MIYLRLQFISGVMLGIEFAWDQETILLDFLILRLIITYGQAAEEEINEQM